jgi:hypothetical protein
MAIVCAESIPAAPIMGRIRDVERKVEAMVI